MGFLFDVLIPAIRIFFSFLPLFLRNGYGLLIYPLGFRRHLERLGIASEEWARSFPQPNELISPTRSVGWFTEAITLHTPDGEQLRAYLTKYQKPDSPAKATVIMFHGNAAIIEFNGIVHQRALESSCNIMSVAYRGYGHSTGTPSETGLRLDAQTALDYVLKQPDLSKNIILYGHSLGGAVSIDLASRNPDKIAGLIIQSTFNSIPKLMSRFPILVPFLFTILQRWESDIKLWSLPRSIPILMLCGLKDQVIPPLEMRILMDVAKLREGGGGSDGSGMGYFERWRARNVIGRIRNARWRAWKNGGGDAAVMEDVDGDILREVIKEIGQRKEPARVITHWFPKADHNNLFEQEGYFERVQAFLRDEVLDLKASEKLVAVDDDEKHAGKYN